MKRISYKVKCGMILLLALVSILSFAILPIIKIRPSDFGIEEATNIEINGTVWNIRNGSAALGQKITDKISIDEMQNLEEEYGVFADLIPGYSKEELHQAVGIITWWIKFPVFLTIAVVVAFVGLFIAGAFAATGIAGVKNKWIPTRMYTAAPTALHPV